MLTLLHLSIQTQQTTYWMEAQRSPCEAFKRQVLTRAAVKNHERTAEKSQGQPPQQWVTENLVIVTNERQTGDFRRGTSAI
jgi:hypothetical protein